MDDLSRWPDSTVELVAVYEMQLHQESVESFVGAITRVHRVLGESDWPGHYAWGVRVAGGELPTFLLVIPYENWSAIDALKSTAWEVLEEAVGEQESEWLQERIGKAVKRQTANFAELVPELSYTPEP